MRSKVENVPCFWCCSVRVGLYASSVGMLNLRCLTIVFGLDETIIVANKMRSFESRIKSLSRMMDVEDDPGRVAGMSAEVKCYIEDKELLKEFIDMDTVTNNGKIVGTQEEEVQPIGTQQRLLQTVIQLPERNAILTHINPEVRDTSVFVKLRPALEDLRSSKKSLQHVFRNGGCHPKMAMVIDDRLQVWDEKDQSRVNVVPAYAPYHAPQAEMANAVPVLCVVRNVACNVHGGFFRFVKIVIVVRSMHSDYISIGSGRLDQNLALEGC
ncbi:hypothetical protein ACQ4PT_043693 [Festuca glaucescens]